MMLVGAAYCEPAFAFRHVAILLARLPKRQNQTLNTFCEQNEPHTVEANGRVILSYGCIQGSIYCMSVISILNKHTEVQKKNFLSFSFPNL